MPPTMQPRCHDGALGASVGERVASRDARIAARPVRFLTFLPSRCGPHPRCRASLPPRSEGRTVRVGGAEIVPRGPRAALALQGLHEKSPALERPRDRRAPGASRGVEMAVLQPLQRKGSRAPPRATPTPTADTVLPSLRGGGTRGSAGGGSMERYKSSVVTVETPFRASLINLREGSVTPLECPGSPRFDNASSSRSRRAAPSRPRARRRRGLSPTATS